jgi:hypothetical protein
MATTAQLMLALDKLTSNGEQFPGLPSNDIIIENYIKTKYPEYEQFDTPEEKQQFIKDTKEVVKQDVEMNILIVKSTFNNIKSGITQVQATIKSTIADAALPSVLPNAGGPSVPNPLSVLQKATAAVNQMLATLNNLVNNFVNLLSAAIKIELTVPDSVVALIDVIGKTRQAILAIPTIK